jgi:hypothetical protein
VVGTGQSGAPADKLLPMGATASSTDGEREDCSLRFWSGGDGFGSWGRESLTA